MSHKVAPRRLNPAERAVLHAIVERAEPRLRDPLLSQIRRAEVVARCGCGCATVYIEVLPDDDAADVPSLIFEVEDVCFVDVASGDLAGGVVITVDDQGYLNCLEFYATSGDPVRETPHVGDLRFFPLDD